MEVLGEVGIIVTNVTSDTMIAADLLNENDLKLKSLASSRLHIEMTEIEDLIGKGSKKDTDVPGGDREKFPTTPAPTPI